MPTVVFAGEEFQIDDDLFPCLEKVVRGQAIVTESMIADMRDICGEDGFYSSQLFVYLVVFKGLEPDNVPESVTNRATDYGLFHRVIMAYARRQKDAENATKNRRKKLGTSPISAPTLQTGLS